MAGGDDLFKAIEAVHAAGLDGTLWPDALRAVGALFGTGVASYEVFDKQPMGLRELRTVGVPPSGELAYLEYYGRNNTRAAFAFRNPAHSVLYDRALIDERGMDRDPYYVKYLAPLGLRYFLTGKIADTADTHAIVSIQRAPRQGHVEKADIARMRRLLPHLRQAYDVGRRLGTSSATRGAFESALDWLADGVALIGADGHLRYVNEALQAIARRNDGVRIRRGMLEFANAAARARFAAALAAIARRHSGDPDAAPTDLALRRPAGNPSYLVSVRPLVREGHAASGAQAIVFVHDPQQRGAGMPGLLREIFGLTEAEAAFAQALREGSSLADYARERRLSLNTVYTHLRRVKEKTGSNRLPELIRKLNDVELSVRRD